MKSGYWGWLALATIGIGWCGVASAQSLERKGPRPGLAIPPDDVGAEDDPPDADKIGVAPIIPPVFRGEWQDDLANCGVPATPMRLRINYGGMRFHGSYADARAVHVIDPRTVHIRAAVTGDRQNWDEGYTLTLSPDGETLTVEVLKVKTLRRRCP